MCSSDLALAQAIAIQHTPTIFVVNNKETGTPFVEVVDRTQLFQLIDKMKREAGPASAAASKGSKKSSTPQ